MLLGASGSGRGSMLRAVSMSLGYSLLDADSLNQGGSAATLLADWRTSLRKAFMGIVIESRPVAISIGERTLANERILSDVYSVINNGSLKRFFSKDDTDVVMKLMRPRVRDCLLYTSPSPRDKRQSRMPSSA